MRERIRAIFKLLFALFSNSSISLELNNNEEYHYHGRCWFHRLTRSKTFREQIS